MAQNKLVYRTLPRDLMIYHNLVGTRIGNKGLKLVTLKRFSIFGKIPKHRKPFLLYSHLFPSSANYIIFLFLC
jgi:hypothetical protein